MVIGYLNMAVKSSPLVTDAGSTRLFNSVQVTPSRDKDHGGLVPSFFSKLMGNPGSAVRVKATATVQNYAITGYKAGTGALAGNARVLPITFDLPTYNVMIGRTTGDRYAYNPDTYRTSTRGISLAPDGVHESLLYPVTNGSGNMGTVNIGVDNNGASVLGYQIRDGITPPSLPATAGS